MTEREALRWVERTQASASQRDSMSSPLDVVVVVVVGLRESRLMREGKAFALP